MARAETVSQEPQRKHQRRTRQLLSDARGRLKSHALKLLGFAFLAYLVLRLLPGLEQALEALQNVGIWWIVGGMAVEIVSEAGYVTSWRGILDPEDLLSQEGRGRLTGQRVAWAQLAGGMIVPGGAIGSIGVGAWMLHRLGISTDRVGERQLTLMTLNTAIDALAIALFGLGLASGLFTGKENLALTLLPAVLAGLALVLALAVARGEEHMAERLEAKHPKIAKGMRTLSLAVQNTKSMLGDRDSKRIVMGAVAYLVFDIAVLWGAFFALGAHPAPGFAVVAMSYLVGGLAGSIPLPANLGAVTGIGGMLIAFGVPHDEAIAALVLYEAIGYLVPLIGGAVAYLFLRSALGAKGDDESDEGTGTPLTSEAGAARA